MYEGIGGQACSSTIGSRYIVSTPTNLTSNLNDTKLAHVNIENHELRCELLGIVDFALSDLGLKRFTWIQFEKRD